MRTTLLTLLILFSVVPARADTDTRRDLATIIRIESFAPFFELGQGAVRLVVVLSPASTQAEATVDAVVRLFAKIPNNRVRAYVILSPDRPEVESIEAMQVWRPVADRRVIGFWDPEGIARGHWQSASGMESPNWDAVFIYDTDARFGATREDAPYWVGDSNSAEPTAIDVAGLEARVQHLLEGFERRTRADTTRHSSP